MEASERHPILLLQLMIDNSVARLPGLNKGLMRTNGTRVGEGRPLLGHLFGRKGGSSSCVLRLSYSVVSNCTVKSKRWVGFDVLKRVCS